MSEKIRDFFENGNSASVNDIKWKVPELDWSSFHGIWLSFLEVFTIHSRRYLRLIQKCICLSFLMVLLVHSSRYFWLIHNGICSLKMFATNFTKNRNKVKDLFEIQNICVPNFLLIDYIILKDNPYLGKVANKRVN